jgi:hypothetical protein
VCTVDTLEPSNGMFLGKGSLAAPAASQAMLCVPARGAHVFGTVISLFYLLSLAIDAHGGH